MCTAIALLTSDLPLDLTQRGEIVGRKHIREGREEFQFHWWQEPTLLPVRWDGRFDLLPWGSKARRGPLPCGGWVAEDHVPRLFTQREEAVIPANLGFQKGT